MHFNTLPGNFKTYQVLSVMHFKMYLNFSAAFAFACLQLPHVRCGDAVYRFSVQSQHIKCCQFKLVIGTVKCGNNKI